MPPQAMPSITYSAGIMVSPCPVICLDVYPVVLCQHRLVRRAGEFIIHILLARKHQMRPAIFSSSYEWRTNYNACITQNLFSLFAFDCYFCHILHSQLYTVMVQKFSPFLFYSSFFLQTLIEHLYWVNLRHNNYWFSRLTYILLLFYLGKVNCIVITLETEVTHCLCTN